jgi:7-cyano-7-deazaguanine synthase
MKAIVLLSGGMDSATLLASVIAGGTDVETLSFCYGSKHNVYENLAARLLAAYYRVPHSLIDLSALAPHLESNLLKNGGAIPEGHYQASNMSQTVVPGRNSIFIAIASGVAWSKGAEEVYIGAHSGDHVIYPDCRPEYVNAMQEAMTLGSGGKVMLKAPFLHGDKTSILKTGFELNVPYQFTRTCYKDQEISCGRCGACQERLEAFEAHGVVDPLPYVARDILPKVSLTVERPTTRY